MLHKLHWLPFRSRIHFKNLLKGYKSINDMASEYMCELVSIRKFSRKLRLSIQILLQVSVSWLKSYSDGAFIVAAPTLWNTLPTYIINVSIEYLKPLPKTQLLKMHSQINNNYPLNVL